MFKYSINLAWSNEDNCYVATVTEFPGLSAMGDTPEEAVEEAKIAVEGFIEVYQEDGCEIPEPDTVKKFSGQTRLRLPKSLHAALSVEAEKEGVSFNSYVLSLLSERNIGRKIEKQLYNLRSEVMLYTMQGGAVEPSGFKFPSTSSVTQKINIDQGMLH